MLLKKKKKKKKKEETNIEEPKPHAKKFFHTPQTLAWVCSWHSDGGWWHAFALIFPLITLITISLKKRIFRRYVLGNR